MYKTNAHLLKISVEGSGDGGYTVVTPNQEHLKLVEDEVIVLFNTNSHFSGIKFVHIVHL